MGKPFRIAVIFTRLGPYHIARLEAAAAALGERGLVTGIEVARTDGIYEWGGVSAGDGARLMTLFPDRHYASIPAREVGAAMRDALDGLDADAAAVNGWSMAEARAGIAWAEQRGRMSVVMSETKADDASRPWWKEAVKRWLLSRCDAALVGGAVHARYLGQMGFPPERITAGYDVVDNDYFRQGAARVRANEMAQRANAGLPENYFFACTRFIARKNVDTLLRAYARYRAGADGAPWGLVIAGDGADVMRLRALERKLGVEGITWPGFVQYGELPLYYGLASAFVHPAVSEPWGLVVNEAIASGLPLIVSQTVGAASELLADGVNGYAFDPQESEHLANAMARMAAVGADALAEMARASSSIAENWEPARFGTGLLAAVAMGKRGRGGMRARSPLHPALAAL